MVLAGIILAVLMGYAASRVLHGRYVHAMAILGLLMFLSELWKQYTLTFVIGHGSYNVWYFPFQLCSLPMYLCCMIAVVPCKWRDGIQAFLASFTLLGGIAVFLDTSGMQYPLLSLTIHSYVWHFLLIFIGSWSGCEDRRASDGRKEGGSNWSGFLRAIVIWSVSVIAAELLNITLWKYGEINMFYISPYESGQIIVRDIAAKIGILPANLLYLLAMLCSAACIYLGWRKIHRYR